MTVTPALPAAVLFDMDGTLVDTEGHWLDAEIQVMAQLGADWHPQDQVVCLGGPLERVTAHMRKRSGSELTDEQVGSMLLDAMEQRLRDTPPVWQPGARSLLQECRRLGIPTALVSASWARLISPVVEGMAADLGIAPFDAVVAGDDVSFSKPHPEPYQRAAQTLGTTTELCLAIEDSPTGVTSARDAGCRVVAVPHLADVSHLGTAVITSLDGWELGQLWREAAP